MHKRDACDTIFYSILIPYTFSKVSVGMSRMASHVSLVQTRAQTLQPIHSLNRTWTGGIGISYFSLGTGSIQSTGQNGIHASHPVQLSSSTQAINLGLVFFTDILSGNSGTVFK